MDHKIDVEPYLGSFSPELFLFHGWLLAEDVTCVQRLIAENCAQNLGLFDYPLSTFACLTRNGDEFFFDGRLRLFPLQKPSFSFSTKSDSAFALQQEESIHHATTMSVKEDDSTKSSISMEGNNVFSLLHSLFSLSFLFLPFLLKDSVCFHVTSLLECHA